jgi:DNA-binding response OmpR family regulator
MSKIVVAEDEVDIARLVAFKLRAAGHDVVIVSDGRAALEAVERERPALLILDAMMPILDGWAVLARLRNDERWRCLPVVILSAQGQEKDRIRGRAAGAQDYIVKPFALADLLPRLERWLGEGSCPPAAAGPAAPFSGDGERRKAEGPDHGLELRF